MRYNTHRDVMLGTLFVFIRATIFIRNTIINNQSHEYLINIITFKQINVNWVLPTRHLFNCEILPLATGIDMAGRHEDFKDHAN